MSAASSSPRHVKLVQCLVQNVLYPCLVLAAPPFFLSRCTFCVIGPSSLLSRHSRLLSPPHQGLVVDHVYHFVYYPLLCYSPSYHWTVYTESALAFWCEATRGCLVRFFGGSSFQSSRYTTNNHPNESFHSHCVYSIG